MEEKKRNKLEKRRLELEKWKRSKQEMKDLMKKMTRPPFRPVGKSTVVSREKLYFDKFLEVKAPSSKSSRLQTTQNNKPAKKFTSTPFIRSDSKPVPRPLKRLTVPKRISQDNTFEIETPIKFESHKLPTKSIRKSVQFKDKIVEISPTLEADNDVLLSQKENHLTNDEIRRISNAGRTPFSCTSSRSGSTPGRRDYPSTIGNMTETDTLNYILESKNETDTNKGTPRTSHRRSRSRSGMPMLKWYVPRNSIMDRDPYLLRSRTPVSVIKTNKSKKSTTASALKKSMIAKDVKKCLKVSFGDILVNKITPETSLNISHTIDDDTLNLFQASSSKLSRNSSLSSLAGFTLSPTTFPIKKPI